MEKCFRCNRNDDEVRLFDGFYGMEGVKVCERCSLIENMPVIKIHNTDEFNKTARQTVRQRLSKLAGLDTGEKKEKSINEKLRDLDDQPELEKPENITFKLVENFHWHVLRTRRRKGLSQKQLAEAIMENEEVIKMIEKNVLPKGALQIIQKLERVLAIMLLKKNSPQKNDWALELPPVLDNDNHKVDLANPEKVLLVDKNLKIAGVLPKLEEFTPQFNVEDLPPLFVPLEDEIYFRNKELEFKILRERERAQIPLKQEINLAAIKNEPSSENSLKLVDFKRQSSVDLTVADLKKIQERTELDSPKTDKFAFGKESTRAVGKEESELIRKAAYRSYTSPVPKKEDAKKVPSIYDLMKKKEERDKEFTGREIDLAHEEKDKIV